MNSIKTERFDDVYRKLWRKNTSFFCLFDDTITLFLYIIYSMNEYVWIVYSVNEYVWNVYRYPISFTCVYELCSKDKQLLFNNNNVQKRTQIQKQKQKQIKRKNSPPPKKNKNKKQKKSPPNNNVAHTSKRSDCEISRFYVYMKMYC